MTKPSQKTHGRRKLRVTLPSGKHTWHFMPRKASKGKCARCGRLLHGVSTTRARQSRTSRVPSRPFAGVLCGNCLASEVRNLVRSSGSTE